MDLKRLLHTNIGRMFISVLLGLGIATLFRRVCTEKNCIRFNGPVISEFADKTYKHGDKCYQYSLETAKCDDLKRSLKMTDDKEN